MKWLKLLDSIAPPYSGRRLSDRLYNELLRAENPEALLKQIAEIYGAYIEEKGAFTDMFGEYSMINNHLNAAAGQFFTPLNVCDCMVAMTLMDDLEGEPKRILDPAAGSGRFMLRTAKYYNDKTSKLNFVFFNVDIDFRMYVYCAMNAILNGIPSVNIWGDSLACKYHEGIVTIPVDPPSPWAWIDSEKATSLMIQPFSGFEMVCECPDILKCDFRVTPAYFEAFCRSEKPNQYMNCTHYCRANNLLKRPVEFLQRAAVSAEDGKPQIYPRQSA